MYIAPSLLDLRAELAAVTSALDTATSSRTSIERQIRSTSGIEVLGTLHEQWEAVTEDLAAARQRMAELRAMLDL